MKENTKLFPKELFHNIILQRKVYFEPLLKEFDLSLIDIEILAFIHEYPKNNTFTDILISKEYSKSHISSSISKLIQREYLIRENSPTNKKVYYLKLIDKSNFIIDEYYRYVGIFQKDALESITQDEIDNFNRLLEKIYHNLQKD